MFFIGFEPGIDTTPFSGDGMGLSVKFLEPDIVFLFLEAAKPNTPSPPVMPIPAAISFLRLFLS